MKTTITKSKLLDNVFYINGSGVLLDHWNYHKSKSFFSNQEKKDFEQYLKEINND